MKRHRERCAIRVLFWKYTVPKMDQLNLTKAQREKLEKQLSNVIPAVSKREIDQYEAAAFRRLRQLTGMAEQLDTTRRAVVVPRTPPIGDKLGTTGDTGGSTYKTKRNKELGHSENHSRGPLFAGRPGAMKASGRVKAGDSFSRKAGIHKR